MFSAGVRYFSHPAVNFLNNWIYKKLFIVNSTIFLIDTTEDIRLRTASLEGVL